MVTKLTGENPEVPTEDPGFPFTEESLRNSRSPAASHGPHVGAKGSAQAPSPVLLRLGLAATRGSWPRAGSSPRTESLSVRPGPGGHVVGKGTAGTLWEVVGINGDTQRPGRSGGSGRAEPPSPDALGHRGGSAAAGRGLSSQPQKGAQAGEGMLPETKEQPFAQGAGWARGRGTWSPAGSQARAAGLRLPGPALCPQLVSTQGAWKWPCPLSARSTGLEGAGAPWKERRMLFRAQLSAV